MFFLIIILLSFFFKTAMQSKAFKVTEDKKTRYIYLDPHDGVNHEFTLIFLHGLGDSATGFYDVFAEEGVVPPTCRVVLPTAPKKPVSCNNGYVMNSWFDIYSLNGKTPSNAEEIRKEYSQKDLNESADLVLAMIEEERNKFEDKDPSRVFIGGFS
jgi:predicted esterase